jgi:hypothetical protein
MLKFFINLRNWFYTRYSRKPGKTRFDYRLSMSALFMPYYFVLISTIDALVKKFSSTSILKFSDNERFLEEILGDIIFWIPLAIVMFTIFRILRRYEPVLMEKKDENRWLMIVIAIFVSGIFTFVFLLKHILGAFGLLSR